MPLQDKAWFSYANHAATATVTTDSEVAALPVTNVNDRLSHRVWRTENEVAKLQFEHSSAVTWQAIGLQFIAHRGPASTAVDEIDATDQITIRASDVSLGGSELLNVTISSNVNRVRGYFGYLADSEITGRYLEIEINAASRSSLGYFNLAGARFGPVFQPLSNYNTGASIRLEEESLVNISPTGGSTFVESRGRLLRFDAVWGLIDEAERSSWELMIEETGTTGVVLFGTGNSSDLSRKMFFARFDDPIGILAGQAKRVSTRATLKENR